ncbi:MAG TPA: TetR/AcrR family transcriptional regulator [Acidimicrobiales bacterium]|jgi:AcrR family transcriptional regulator
MASSTTTARASARDRLLEAANELFYAEGVQTVGIDRIIERAGVAKASLYNVFGSKEELVAAYLESRHQGTATRLSAAMEKIQDPREKIFAIFDEQAKQFRDPNFHGCAFVSASAEAPVGGLVEQATTEFRAWIRNTFAELAKELGAAHPSTLARQLHLVYDGALLAADLDRNEPSVARSAREAVEALLNASSV